MTTIDRRLRATVLALGTVWVLAACSGAASPSGSPSGSPGASAPPSGAPPSSAIDADGDWRLTNGTNGGAAIPIVPDADITLTVDGSQVSGRSACNRYGGEVIVKDGQVQFGPLMMTEMACAEPVMASEAAYHAALGNVRAAVRVGDTLTLSGQGVELVYERVTPPPTAELVGTAWVLDSIITGDAVSSVMGDPAELRLAADGTMTGTTGCRGFSARYTGTDRTITVSDFAVDAADCPADLASQDTAIVAVLGSGFSAAIDGQRLTLTSANGAGLGYTTRGSEIPPAP